MYAVALSVCKHIQINTIHLSLLDSTKATRCKVEISLIISVNLISFEMVTLLTKSFLDLAVAKSLQSTRMVTDDDDADVDDV